MITLSLKIDFLKLAMQGLLSSILLNYNKMIILYFVAKI